MVNFKLEVAEKRRYWARFYWDVCIALIMVIIIFFFIYITIPEPKKIGKYLLYASIFPLGKFILCTLKDRYYITFLEVNNNKVIIQYKDRDIANSAEGDSSDFVFTRSSMRWPLLGSNQAYLKVKYKGRTIIKQYSTGEWDQSKLIYLQDNIGSGKMVWYGYGSFSPGYFPGYIEKWL